MPEPVRHRNKGTQSGTGMLQYTVKKSSPFSRPQPGCHWSNSSWAGIIYFFPPRESLVSDIPAGDEKMANSFLQCTELRYKMPKCRCRRHWPWCRCPAMDPQHCFDDKITFTYKKHIIDMRVIKWLTFFVLVHQGVVSAEPLFRKLPAVSADPSFRNWTKNKWPF